MRVRPTRLAGWMVWLALGTLALGCSGSDGGAGPLSATGDEAVPASEGSDAADVTTTTPSVEDEMNAFVAELCGRLETEEVQQAMGVEVEPAATDVNGCTWQLDTTVRFHLGWLSAYTLSPKPIDHVIDEYVQRETRLKDDIVVTDAGFGDRSVLLADSPSQLGYYSTLIVRIGENHVTLTVYFHEETPQADLTAKLDAIAEVLVPRLADLPPSP
jgi:hypothetical protein